MRSGLSFASLWAACGVVCAGLAAWPREAEAMLFGTVGATSTAHAAEQYQAGLRLAHVGLSWSRYETSDGSFSSSYLSQVKKQIQDYRAAGMQVTLDFGMQYAPSWIYNIPNSRYVNQYGDSYTSTTTGGGGPNAVFNQSVRNQQAAYVQRIFADLGTDFYAVRLGWGYYGELNYPSNSYNGRTNAYWGYDVLAQGGYVAGVSRPAGIPACPVPGWKPGSASTNHNDARAVVNWYLNALDNYQDWQIDTVRQSYAGKLAVLYPSWGVRPGQLDAAINRDLNGSTSAEINGEIQRGFDFARYISGIDDPNVVVYTTWLDAQTSTLNDASSDPTKWSPAHYLASLAEAQSLAMWGENTGHGDLAAMQLSFQRAQQYNMLGLMWAFEDELYGGQYASLGNYAQLIAQTPEPGVLALLVPAALLLQRAPRPRIPRTPRR